MTLEPKASLEKQNEWIDKLVMNLSKIPEHTRLGYARKVIKRHLPKGDTYQRGYQKGQDYLRKEVESFINDDLIPFAEYGDKEIPKWVIGGLKATIYGKHLSPTDTK